MSTKESNSQARNRNKKAKELLYQLFTEAAEGPLDAQLDDGAQRVLNKALGPLKNDPPWCKPGGRGCGHNLGSNGSGRRTLRPEQSY